VRRSTTASIVYEYDPLVKSGVTLTFEISGTIVPYVPASMYGGPDNLGHPAEGGGVEDIEVRLLSASNADGAVIPTQGMAAKLTADFEKAIESRPDLRDEIETLLFEEANQQNEPDQDAAYDRYIDKHGLAEFRD
jgi:hypothetical protein